MAASTGATEQEVAAVLAGRGIVAKFGAAISTLAVALLDRCPLQIGRREQADGRQTAALAKVAFALLVVADRTGAIMAEQKPCDLIGQPGEMRRANLGGLCDRESRLANQGCRGGRSSLRDNNSKYADGCSCCLSRNLCARAPTKTRSGGGKQPIPAPPPITLNDQAPARATIAASDQTSGLLCVRARSVRQNVSRRPRAVRLQLAAAIVVGGPLTQIRATTRRGCAGSLPVGAGAGGTRGEISDVEGNARGTGGSDDDCRAEGEGWGGYVKVGGSFGDSNEAGLAGGQSAEKQKRQRLCGGNHTFNQAAGRRQAPTGEASPTLSGAKSIERSPEDRSSAENDRSSFEAERRRARARIHRLALIGARDSESIWQWSHKQATGEPKRPGTSRAGKGGRRLEGSSGGGATDQPGSQSVGLRVETARAPLATKVAVESWIEDLTSFKFGRRSSQPSRSSHSAKSALSTVRCVARGGGGGGGGVASRYRSGDTEGALGRHASSDDDLRLACLKSPVDSSSPVSLVLGGLEPSRRQERREGEQLLQNSIERPSERQTNTKRAKRKLRAPRRLANEDSKALIVRREAKLAASPSTLGATTKLPPGPDQSQQAQVVVAVRRAPPPQASRAAAPEETSEELVQLLAEFYARSIATGHNLEQYLQRFKLDEDDSEDQRGTQDQDHQRQPETSQISVEFPQQRKHESLPSKASRKLARIKMKLGADEESLLKWLRQRQERFSSLKNATFELLTEYPNRTINVCLDGPKILVLPNVSDILYCYTRDQWIDKLWSDLHLSPFHYPIIVLNMLIFLFGTTGNIFVCLSVYRNHQLRDVTNYFIVNLAFADFLVILICLPATVVWDLSLTWFFGTIPCKLIMFLQDVSISVSVLTLTAISIDRYYAICHPLMFKSNLNQAKRIIALIWLVSLSLMAPDLVYLSAKESQDLSEAGLETVLYSDCNYNWSEQASRVFQFVKTILLYLVPFILMFCAHFKIMRTLQVASSVANQPPPTQFCSGSNPIGAARLSVSQQTRQPSSERPNNKLRQLISATSIDDNQVISLAQPLPLGESETRAGLRLVASGDHVLMASSSSSIAGTAPSPKRRAGRFGDGALARIGRCHSEFSALVANRLRFDFGSVSAATSLSIDTSCFASPELGPPERPQKKRGHHRTGLKQRQPLELSPKSASRPARIKLRVGKSHERRPAHVACALGAPRRQQQATPSSQQQPGSQRQIHQFAAKNSPATFASSSSVSSQQRQLMVTMHNKNKLESRSKVAKMLMAIVALFGLCYLPVHLINFLRQFIEDIPQTDVTSTISMLAHCFCYLNSAINPIIYNHMNSVFRAEFKRFLSSCFSGCPCKRAKKEADRGTAEHHQQQQRGRAGQQQQQSWKMLQQNRLLRSQDNQGGITTHLTASRTAYNNSNNDQTSLVIITDCIDSLAKGCATPQTSGGPSAIVGGPGGRAGGGQYGQKWQGLREEPARREETEEAKGAEQATNIKGNYSIAAKRVSGDNMILNDSNTNSNNTVSASVLSEFAAEDSRDSGDSGGLARSQLGSIAISFATTPTAQTQTKMATTSQTTKQQTTPI